MLNRVQGIAVRKFLVDLNGMSDSTQKNSKLIELIGYSLRYLWSNRLSNGRGFY